MNDSELQASYRDHHARGASERGQCLSAEDLAAAARTNDASPAPDRSHIIDHLISCTSCSDELKMLRSLGDWSDALAIELDAEDTDDETPRRTLFWSLAAAAVFALLAVGLGLWGAAQAQLARDAQRARDDLAAEIDAVRAAAADSERARGDLEERVAALTAPRVNVALVDLDPDSARVRGGDTSHRTVTVPRTDSFFNLILHAGGPGGPSTFRVELDNASGDTVFAQDGVERGEFGTFTLALSPASVPEGSYRLEVRVGGTTVERYSFRVEYR